MSKRERKSKTYASIRFVEAPSLSPGPSERHSDAEVKVYSQIKVERVCVCFLMSVSVVQVPRGADKIVHAM